MQDLIVESYHQFCERRRVEWTERFAKALTKFERPESSLTDLMREQVDLFRPRRVKIETD